MVLILLSNASGRSSVLESSEKKIWFLSRGLSKRVVSTQQKVWALGGVPLETGSSPDESQSTTSRERILFFPLIKHISLFQFSSVTWLERVWRSVVSLTSMHSV